MVLGGKSQDFPGRRWVGPLLAMCPEERRRSVALGLLALSPHYFFRNETNRTVSRTELLEREYDRNRASRLKIVESLVWPYLDRNTVVLDFGCGPGFLGSAVARYARQVYGCDISNGVIECAQVINPARNLTYAPVTDGRIPLKTDSIDLICAFAVIQHVTDAVLANILLEWRRVLRPGGKAICHVVLNDEGWRTEAAWHSDATATLIGKARWRFGLHCFSRTPQAFSAIVGRAGFSKPHIRKISDLGPDLEDDIQIQHLAIFEHMA
jgi:SAM-dependent methyltransferase